MEGPRARGVLAFLLGVGLALTLFAPAPGANGASPEELHAAVNRVRMEQHLRPLDSRAELAAVAEQHARDMIARGYLSHVSPEGKNPLERAQGAGLAGFRLLAENIGVTSVRTDPHLAVLSDWLRSPDHRANILHPAFNAAGIGRAEGGGQVIYVQLFAAY
jgi:uncharacterized protein YkwD